MTGPRGMPPSLDLRALETLLDICATRGELIAIVSCGTLRALLIHIRALRTVAVRADTLVYECDPVDWTALGECLRDFHDILALARDEDTPGEAKSQPE